MFCKFSSRREYALLMVDVANKSLKLLIFSKSNDMGCGFMLGRGGSECKCVGG